MAERDRAVKALKAADRRLEEAKISLVANPSSAQLLEARAAQEERERAALLLEAYTTRCAAAEQAHRQAEREHAIALIEAHQSECDLWPAQVTPVLERIIQGERAIWSAIEELAEISDRNSDDCDAITRLCRENGLTEAEFERPLRPLELALVRCGQLIDAARRAEGRPYLEGCTPSDFLRHRCEPRIEGGPLGEDAALQLVIEQRQQALEDQRLYELAKVVFEQEVESCTTNC
jgi:hypothetical protein